MKNNFLKTIPLGLVCLFSALLGPYSNKAFADQGDFGIGMSPMNQKIILVPGETYMGSFTIVNPAGHTEDFHYTVTPSPFYVNENYDIYYDNNGDYNQMVDWISIDNREGVIAPNNTVEIPFSISVPSDAPAGGQYAAIIVSSKTSGDNVDGGVNLRINQAMAHIVYAEIAGTTVRKGEVTSADVPSFLFSGNIAGNSTIKNTGNVHATANYKLQVFPLFSNEEIYTNEEDPQTLNILPERSRYNSTEWPDTPSMGIFNVVYTAEFEGVITEVKKMVIVCPLWLLFVIIFAAILIIFWLISRSKSRRK